MKINIRKIILTQCAVAAASLIVLVAFGYPHIIPFLMGALLITVNFVFLFVFWDRVFQKKPIATTAIVVVSKYAILIVTLYVFVSLLHMPLVPLAAGVGTLAGSFLILALQNMRSKNQ